MINGIIDWSEPYNFYSIVYEQGIFVTKEYKYLLVEGTILHLCEGKLLPIKEKEWEDEIFYRVTGKYIHTFNSGC